MRFEDVENFNNSHDVHFYEVRGERWHQKDECFNEEMVWLQVVWQDRWESNADYARPAEVLQAIVKEHRIKKIAFVASLFPPGDDAGENEERELKSWFMPPNPDDRQIRRVFKDIMALVGPALPVH